MEEFLPRDIDMFTWLLKCINLNMLTISILKYNVYNYTYEKNTEI